MVTRRTRWRQLTLFLSLFFLVWTLRATVFYGVDESIGTRPARAAYSDFLKLLLWVLPAAAFARVLRKARPARYLGLSVWPDGKNWLVCLGVTAAFLLVTGLGTMALGGKLFSMTRLASMPMALWILSGLLAPLLEELQEPPGIDAGLERRLTARPGLAALTGPRVVRPPVPSTWPRGYSVRNGRSCSIMDPGHATYSAGLFAGFPSKELIHALAA